MISEADITHGGNGADAILGGPSDEIIIGGGGDDNLFGEGSADRFLILDTDDGTDTLTNFAVGNILDVSDLIDFGAGETSGVIAFQTNGADVDIIDNSANGGGATVAVIDTALAGNLSIDADGQITTV